MNGICCLGDNDDPGIRICVGEEGGMNDKGSRSEDVECPDPRECLLTIGEH